MHLPNNAICCGISALICKFQTHFLILLLYISNIRIYGFEMQYYNQGWFSVFISWKADRLIVIWMNHNIANFYWNNWSSASGVKHWFIIRHMCCRSRWRYRFGFVCSYNTFSSFATLVDVVFDGFEDAEEVDGFELDGPDVDDVDAHDFHPKSVSDTHQ